MDRKQHSFLWGKLLSNRDSWNQRVTELWAKTPLFKGIPKREIASLTESMHLRHYQADEFVFHAGDLGAGAAIILEGKVAIRSGEALLAELGPGDFFGEISLVLDERRTADAAALEESELVFFLKQELENWIARVPKYGARLSSNLAHILANRLSHANSLLAKRANSE